MDIEQQLQLEIMKREAMACKDIEAMRALTLKALEVAEMQRQWLYDNLARKSAPV